MLSYKDRQSPALVAECLGWRHQPLLVMQDRYTHIYAESLRVIADAIDRIYSPPRL